MKFTENHKLGDILSEHYQILLLLSRFGISLGVGDKTVGQVCQEAEVDCPTFLAVVNYVATSDSTLYHQVKVSAMMSFLREAHHYYTDFLLPELRNKLEKVVSGVSDTTMSELVLRLFDTYATAVNRHLAYENKVLFNYANRLNDGEEGLDAFNLSNFISQHDNIDTHLLELKNVMIRYFPCENRAREVHQVLYDIFGFEADLRSHCDIEDNLFIPSLVDMERRAKNIKK